MASQTFLTGPAGTGKTTRGVAHLKQLLAEGVSPYNILILVPQRTVAAPYQAALEDTRLKIPGEVDIVTMDGLALRTLNLVWPQVAAPAGFGYPTRRPIFLTIETAQYYMAQVIAPLLASGYFDPNVVSVTITLPRLMSQLLDNLEKAALIDLPYTGVGARLKAALGEEIKHRVAFDHAEICITAFREFCLRHNLLDFSLRVETFRNFVWPRPQLRRLLTHRYRHLIVDNLEEQNPFAHRILADWLPLTESAWLIFDEEAGYRIFLGASWRTAAALQSHCQTVETATQSLTAPPAMLNLGRALGRSLGAASAPPPEPPFSAEDDPRAAFTFQQTRFHPQMITWAVDRIEELIGKQGVSANEIVVLAPFVSDALRFSFLNQMERRNLPARAHRPSRALKEEPAATAMLTLARLMQPNRDLLPNAFDVMRTLSLTIDGLDLVRANLLVEVLYRPYDRERGPLYPFEEVEGPMRERITYQLGQRFDQLRLWLKNEADMMAVPLDHTFSRLFGEVLSQPGFGFHQSLEAGEVVANLVESVKKFRRVTARVPITQIGPTGQPEEVLPSADYLNQAYLEMIEQGIVAALYTRSWDPAPAEAVLIAPAYTYLMSNRPVEYQFWLDAGSSGWWERIAQSLTHPYVLAVDWDEQKLWRDEDEVAAQNDRLNRLILGLTRRCKKHLFITNSEISEQGYEQRGRLLLALQQTLRRLG